MFISREITKNDFSIEMIEMLNSISNSINMNNENSLKITFDTFIDYLKENTHHKVYVLYDNEINKVIGMGTLLLEKKIIHNFGTVGHIEDIVIHKDYQNQEHGKRILRNIIYEAKKEKCYKVILNCKEELEEFYKKCGLEKKNIQMAYYF
jgi:glucosamine-phosphate N-acetyltransferase